jgi:hypothetical protein
MRGDGAKDGLVLTDEIATLRAPKVVRKSLNLGDRASDSVMAC